MKTNSLGHIVFKGTFCILSFCLLFALASSLFGQRVLAANNDLYPYFGFPSHQNAPTLNVAANTVYYEDTIKNIIQKNCSRCHSGPVRNLMDYDNLKVYADNQMLQSMVSPGGPMSRFAGNDASSILAWASNGALEKPNVAVPATFLNFGLHPNQGITQNIPCGPQGQKAFDANMPYDQITYTNTIKFIVAKNCLECHSGKFRNLTTYNNLKFYADSGLLQKLVRPGGEMHRFAGPDTQFFEAWINNKTPK